MNLCSVGRQMGRHDCSGQFTTRGDLSQDEVESIRLRSNAVRLDNICYKHYNEFIVCYSLNVKKCCDPFGRHRKTVSGTVIISLEQAKTFPQYKMIPGKKLCRHCCSKLSREDAAILLQPAVGKEEEALAPIQEDYAPESQSTSGSGSHQVSQGVESEDIPFSTPPDIALQQVNNFLELLGVLEIDINLLHTSKRYVSEKVSEIVTALLARLGKIVNCDFTDITSQTSALAEVISQLKEKYEVSDRSKQIALLSVLPKSWTFARVQEEFEASTCMLWKVKNLVADQGVLPTISIKSGAGLSEDIKKKVLNYYYENSWKLPGKEDFKSVQVGGMIEHGQKMLLLMTLRELHSSFEDAHPGEISLTKFSLLRPKECVLPGARGTHTVCVCVHHENFELMLDASGVKVEDETTKRLKLISISQALHKTICNHPRRECYFGECMSCPGTVVLKTLIESYFEDLLDDRIKFNQWVTLDRCALEEFEYDTEDFIATLINRVPALLKHHFIYRAQAQHLCTLKHSLKEDECIVIGDFSENYSPVIQDAVQGVHWDNTQITIHPFVCYHKVESELKMLKFVVVSDSTTHDTAAVFAFQHKLIPFLKDKIPNLEKVRYFSDWAASQYQNRKNALNLRMHFEDFGVKAEWHFFASCHGKGPCDRIGAVVKREVTRENLKRVQRNPIKTATQLYKWAVQNFKTMKIVFVSKQFIEDLTERYSERFESAPAVKGIKSSHCLIPLSKNVIEMKEFSNAYTYKYVYHGSLENPVFDDMFGYLILSHENIWYLGFVTKRYIDEKKVEIVLLERQGTKNLFEWSRKRKTIKVTVSEVITIVNIGNCENGIQIPRKCINFANKEIEKRNLRAEPSRKPPKKRKK